MQAGRESGALFIVKNKEDGIAAVFLLFRAP